MAETVFFMILKQPVTIKISLLCEFHLGMCGFPRVTLTFLGLISRFSLPVWIFLFLSPPPPFSFLVFLEHLKLHSLYLKIALLESVTLLLPVCNKVSSTCY